MHRIIYNSLLVIFLFMFIWVLFKSEIQNSGEIRVKYIKYYLIFGILLLIFSIGIYINKKVQLYILISTFSLIFSLYSFETFILYKSYKNKKIKENLYQKISSKKYDNRSLEKYFNDKKKINKNVTVAVYPDSFNKDKEISIFPLAGISNKETILCNENGFYVHYFSDRYGFNNVDTEWDKKSIDYLLLGDSFAHGFCVNQQNNITSIMKKITNKNVINLGYGGNGPLIQLASLKEFKPDNVSNIIWMYSEYNDLIDIGFEINNPILKKYFFDENFSQDLKSKQNIIDNIGEKKILSKKNKVKNYKFSTLIKNFIFLNNLRFFISKKTNFYIPEKNFQIFETIISNFIKYSNENKSKPYFVYIPSYNTFNDKINSVNYLRIKSIIDKLNIEFIDLRKEISDEKLNIKTLFPYNLPGHYSEKGYRYITNKMIKYIK